ncbi:hypothetical protein ACE1SV_61820 [Streptomyces sennicomposti]
MAWVRVRPGESTAAGAHVRLCSGHIDAMGAGECVKAVSPALVEGAEFPYRMAVVECRTHRKVERFIEFLERGRRYPGGHAHGLGFIPQHG